MLVKFNQPYTFEGKEYTELEIPLENLTGKDHIAISKGMSADGSILVPVPAMSSEFCMRAAARAAKLPLEFFEQMPFVLYTQTVQQVSTFLLGAQ